jgi:hypothetical protein
MRREREREIEKNSQYRGKNASLDEKGGGSTAT